MSAHDLCKKRNQNTENRSDGARRPKGQRPISVFSCFVGQSRGGVGGQLSTGASSSGRESRSSPVEMFRREMRTSRSDCSNATCSVHRAGRLMYPVKEVTKEDLFPRNSSGLQSLALIAFGEVLETAVCFRHRARYKDEPNTARNELWTSRRSKSHRGPAVNTSNCDAIR